jgi:hypothetical protein
MAAIGKLNIAEYEADTAFFRMRCGLNRFHTSIQTAASRHNDCPGFKQR